MSIVLQGPAPVLRSTYILRVLPVSDEGDFEDTIAYRLRWVFSSGVKVWDDDKDGPDKALPSVALTFNAGPILGGQRTWNLRNYPEIMALARGIYDLGVTTIDAAGNESGFLSIPAARFFG